MEKERKRSVKTSQQQYKIYLDFFNSHPLLKTGRLTSQMDGKEIERLWEELTLQLNSCGSGPQKDVKGWKRVFAEWKSVVKRKGRMFTAEMKKTGGGPPKTLSNIEHKLLQSIGPVLDGLDAVVDGSGLEVPDLPNTNNQSNQNETAATSAIGLTDTEALPIGLLIEVPLSGDVSTPSPIPSTSTHASPLTLTPASSSPASTSVGLPTPTPPPKEPSERSQFRNRRRNQNRPYCIGLHVVEAIRDSHKDIIASVNEMNTTLARLANAQEELVRIKKLPLKLEIAKARHNEMNTTLARLANAQEELARIKKLKLKLEIAKARQNNVHVDFDV